MELKKVRISEEPMELYKLLKMENLVCSGGEAKYAIAGGRVRVNGVVEYRKRKKIFAGDTIEFQDCRLKIEPEADDYDAVT